jgi:hypothetical protein
MTRKPRGIALPVDCPVCLKMTQPVLEDYGFAHAFGSETDWQWECSECGEILPEVELVEPDYDD